MHVCASETPPYPSACACCDCLGVEGKAAPVRIWRSASEAGKEGENRRACKRWKCALITEMAIVGILPPESRAPCPAPFLVMQNVYQGTITHAMSRHDWACSKALVTHFAWRLMHACMHIPRRMTRTKAHAQTHTHARTPARPGDRWQWPDTLRQWQGQDGSGHYCALRIDQLDLASSYSAKSWQNSLWSQKFPSLYQGGGAVIWALRPCSGAFVASG